MKSTGISRGITQRASCQSNDIDTGVCKVLSGFLRLDNIDSIVSELIDEADSNPPYHRMWEDIDPKYKKKEILEKVIRYICDYEDDSLDPILELVESKLKTL